MESQKYRFSPSILIGRTNPMYGNTIRSEDEAERMLFEIDLIKKNAIPDFYYAFASRPISEAARGTFAKGVAISDYYYQLWKEPRLVNLSTFRNATKPLNRLYQIMQNQNLPSAKQLRKIDGTLLPDVRAGGLFLRELKRQNSIFKDKSEPIGLTFAQHGEPVVSDGDEQPLKVSIGHETMKELRLYEGQIVMLSSASSREILRKLDAIRLSYLNKYFEYGMF